MSENKVSSILKNISGEIKIKILKFLSQNSENPQSFTSIMGYLKMDPSSDAGKFGYHLKMLKENKVIQGGAETGYTLTGLGEKVVEVIWDISDTAVKKEIQVRTSDYSIVKFDRSRIKKALMKEANMPEEKAEDMARLTEEKLLNSNINYLTAPLIREAVNYILLENGLENYRHQLTRLGLPPHDVKELIKNPLDSFYSDSIKKISGDAILEQFLFLNVLDFKISDAHLSGEIFMPNANNFILLPNSIQHDARVFLQNGLSNVFLNSLSPPKSLNGALQLLTKLFNEIKNTNEQSFDLINIFLAPYIDGLSSKEIKSSLSLFIENIGASSLNCIKTLNFNFEIPEIIANTKVIGPNLKASLKYGDLQLESLKILELVLEILTSGDHLNRPFLNPNCFFKLKSSYLTNSEMERAIQKLYELISIQGTPFLINLDADSSLININQTAALDVLSSDWKEPEIDTLRTGNSDWVLVNLPRIAIDAEGDDDKFFELLKKRLEIAAAALMEKEKQIKRNINIENFLPLLSLKVQKENYYRLENCTYSIAFLGLKEAILYHKKSELIDNMEFAVQILTEMKNHTNQIQKNNNIRFHLKQVPYNAAWSVNLMQMDKKKINNLPAKIKDKWDFTSYDGSYYSSKMETKNLIDLELKLNSNLDGYLTSIPFTEKPDLNDVIKNTKSMLGTKLKFFAFNFPYTYCNSCNERSEGAPKKCECGASEINLSYYQRKNANYFY